MLGPLEVHDGTDRVAIGGARARAVLARLLIAAGRPVPIATLVDELWGDDPPPTAVATVQTYISRLRRVLPTGALTTEAAGYALRPLPGEVDRDVFEAFVSEGQAASDSGDVERAARALRAALALWRGPALTELADTERGAIEIARLEELRLVAEEERFEAELAAGRHHDVLADLERAVAEQPLRERRWGHLMLALYRAGRQADATRRFHELRTLLGDELGLEPSPELMRLEHAILTQDAALDAPALAPARVSKTSSLPVALTSFVGRQVEVAELDAAARANRLVTVVGPGGVGKTRLAVELGRLRAAEDDHEDVVFVELAGHTGARHVEAAVAAGLGVTQTAAGLAADVVAALGQRPTLLLLDNCEHVVADVAALADALLRAAPNLKVVATSREPLGVAGEAVWRLPPLGADDAVTLFRVRAGQADSADDDALRTVCDRLDRLPLAIELAAARLRTLGLPRLMAGLDDRFRALGPGPRTGPQRQRTLRALVEWSYELLDHDQQTLLAVLSVLAGGFDAEAVVAVSASVPGLDALDAQSALDGFADKSLLDVEPDGRYRMLETIRDFAAERLASLGFVDVVRRAHLEYFTALARAAASSLHREQQPQWLARLDTEHANVRVAADWALAEPTRAPLALAIGVSLFRFWFVRGHLTEGRELIEAALRACPDEPPDVRAKGHLRAGGLAGEQGDQAAARQHLNDALRLAQECGEHDVEALAINEMAQSARGSGDLIEAVQLAERAVDVARTGSGTHTLATCLANAGAAVLAGGHYAEARTYFDEARALHELEGDVFGVAVVLGNSAVAAFQEGDLVSCRRYIDEANALNRRVGNRHGLATSRIMEAQVCLVEGELEQAEAAALEALEVMREQVRSVNLSITLGTIAEIRLARGTVADDVIAEKIALDRAIGFSAGEAAGLVMLARARLAAEDFDRAARAATDAVDLARGSGYDVVVGTALGVAGLIDARRHRYAEAAESYEEALALLRPVDSHHERATVLREYAELARTTGDTRRERALLDELDQIAH